VCECFSGRVGGRLSKEQLWAVFFLGAKLSSIFERKNIFGQFWHTRATFRLPRENPPGGKNIEYAKFILRKPRL